MDSSDFKLVILTLYFFLAYLFAGCQTNPVSKDLVSKATSTQTHTATATDHPAITSSPRPLPTGIATISTTSTKTLVCEEYLTLTEFESFRDFQGYRRLLKNKLNECFEIASIAQTLQDSEWFQGFVELIDLNGDGTLELIIGGGVEFPNPRSLSRPWMIHILAYYKKEGIYKDRLFFSGSYNGEPELIGVEDIDSDSNSELIIYTTYGGTWCEQYVTVIGFRDGRPADLFGTRRGWSDCSAEIYYRDLDGDGKIEFILCPWMKDCSEQIPSGSVIYRLNSMGRYESERVP